nr:stress-induced protein 12 [Ipomoea batatas]
MKIQAAKLLLILISGLNLSWRIGHLSAIILICSGFHLIPLQSWVWILRHASLQEHQLDNKMLKENQSLSSALIHLYQILMPRATSTF